MALVALAACKGGDGAAAGARPTPSGLPVPRYASLKFDEINARGGPGEDYRLLWVYRAKGLPVQVLAETTDWRRVCDPTGGFAWVKATGVDARRTVLHAGAAPLPLLSRPDSGGKVQAYVGGRSVAGLEVCKAGWCRLKASGASGWAPASAFWGTAPAPQCH